MNPEPLISIVIPVKNGERWLDKLFDRLEAQTLYGQCEVIILDSGSADRSALICSERNARVMHVPASEFNHGLTRNLGASAARGKYVLMTVQDAYPADNRFLEKMLSGFEEIGVAAVCGLQVVPEIPDTNPLHWYRPVSTPQKTYYQYTEPGQYEALSPSEKKAICGWDDVCAMYKKDVLIRLPFRKITFGEDMAWCQDALRAGLKICYNPLARVFHYHANELDYLYRRLFTEAYFSYKIFSLVPENRTERLLLLKIMCRLFRSKQVPLNKKLFWMVDELRSHQVSRTVINDFLSLLKKGSTELDKHHQIICGVAPQPAKV